MQKPPPGDGRGQRSGNSSSIPGGRRGAQSRSAGGFLEPLFAGGYFPAFNVADTAITLGAACLILDELLRVKRSR